MVSLLFLHNSNAETPALEIPEASLTLENAFQIALQNNPSIEQVEQRIRKAEGTMKRVRSYMLPSIDVSGSQMYRHASAYPESAPTTRITADYNVTTAGATLYWRFFQGLQDIEYLRAARKGLESAKLLYKDVQRILLDQVSQTFIQSESAKAQMQIAKSNYEFNLRLLDNAKIRFDLGEMREADVLNFKLGLNQAEGDFLTAKKYFETANSILAMLLGKENGKLSEGQYPLFLDGISIDPIPSENSALAKAFSQRPDLQALQTSVESFAHQVKALKGSYMPTLDLVTGITYNKTNNKAPIDQDQNYSHVGVVMNWNLFSGGRKQAQLIEMRADKQVQVQQFILLRNQIAAQVQQDLIALENAYQLLNQRKDAEGYARQIRDFVEEAYLSGEVTITRLNEAQNNWITAKNGHSIAKLQVLQGQYSLKASTGEILSIVPTDLEE